MERRSYVSRAGVKQFTPIATMDELMDPNGGFCLACGQECSGVEPDARGYKCEFCGASKVYGLEELLLMGLVSVVPED